MPDFSFTDESNRAMDQSIQTDGPTPEEIEYEKYLLSLELEAREFELIISSPTNQHIAQK